MASTVALTEARTGRGAGGRRGRAPRTVSRRVALAVLALLSVQFAALCLHQAWNDSATFDEPVYTATALATLYDGELRLNNEAPLLPKVERATPAPRRRRRALDGAWADADTIDDDGGSSPTSWPGSSPASTPSAGTCNGSCSPAA